MANYKPRLQVNNVDLASILEDINALPPAGTEDISAELNALSDAVDAHLKMVNRKVAENNGEGQYVWKKMASQDGDVLDYVVSSDESAYPDNGEKDGYWYIKYDPSVNIPENIRENINNWGILGAMSEGITGVDYGVVTISNYPSAITVKHNLGKVPRAMLLFAIGMSNYGTSLVFQSSSLWQIDQYGISFSSRSQMTLATTATGSATYDATQITFKAHSANSFQPLSYQWIALA